MKKYILLTVLCMGIIVTTTIAQQQTMEGPKTEKKEAKADKKAKKMERKEFNGSDRKALKKKEKLEKKEDKKALKESENK